jgi:parallel beta-helix repeat protein
MRWLFAGLLVLTLLCLQTVSAQTPISSCTEITSSGYYYLTQNLTGLKSGANYCIGIRANNVVLDGNGHSLTGPNPNSYTGVYIFGVSNVMVKNLTVSNYSSGISLLFSSYNTITNVTANNNGNSGLYLYTSSTNNNVITNVTANNNGNSGLYLDNSPNNVITNVTANNNGNYGIYLSYSNSNTIKNSVLQNNSYGIVLVSSGNNLIYNNYFNNTNNLTILNSRPNTWNVTKTEGRNIVWGNILGGNYWGSSNGAGFSDVCEDSDSDGICDQPYVIDSNNIDYLPLTRIMFSLIPDAIIVKVQYLDTGTTSYYSISITVYPKRDRVYNVSASLDISGVNPDYGANITVELLSKVTLTDMSYNGSSVSYTYLGQNTSNSRIYNVYNFTTTANGTLVVNGAYANRAWDTVVKIDKKVEQIPTLTAVLGESVEMALPARGNITLPSGAVLTNVTSFSFNTRGFGVGNLLFILEINVPESDDYGQLTVSINTVYANRTVTVLDKDGEAVSGVGVYAYNIDTSDFTPANAIVAGNNTIQVFFRDMKLAETALYVNHTNISDSLTMSVFSKLLPTDYKNANKRIYVQKDFNLTIFDAKVSRFAINLTEPSYVYIDFARNFSRPQLILNNCSLISYAFPYAKLYCSGNATVAEGYAITLQVKDALGRPIDIVFALDNESLSSNRGIATVIKPVGNYSLTLPFESLGFKLKTNATYSITLENDTSITAVYKVPTRIESREVRIEKRFPFPFLPFETQETDNASSVTNVRIYGSVMDYFGAPVPNRNVIIEIKAVGGATTYANTTTDSSGNFVAQANFTTNTTYMITYTLPEDSIYVGTSSVKTLTYEAIAPPPAPSPIGVTIPITVIVAVIALVAVLAVVAVAKSVRKKTVKHMLEDMSEFRFFRRVR